MTSHPVANRQARRRGITFAILIAITLLLMAFSANPYVQEVQRGLSFALRPFQGGDRRRRRRRRGRRGRRSARSTAADRERHAARRERATRQRERAAPRRSSRRTTQLTALLQLQGGFDHETVATRVIGRESLDTRQMVTLDKGTDDGIAQGDVVIVQGGALAGRVTDVGPTFAKVTLISDATSTVVGQLAELGQDRRGRGPGRAASWSCATSTRRCQIGTDEEVFTAGHRDQRRDPVALPEGPRDRLRGGRRARRERRGPDGVPRARPRTSTRSSCALVITDYDGRPAAGRRAAGPVRRRTARCPEGEVPCYTPTPRPPAARGDAQALTPAPRAAPPSLERTARLDVAAATASRRIAFAAGRELVDWSARAAHGLVERAATCLRRAARNWALEHHHADARRPPPARTAAGSCRRRAPAAPAASSR